MIWWDFKNETPTWISSHTAKVVGARQSVALSWLSDALSCELWLQRCRCLVRLPPLGVLHQSHMGPHMSHREMLFWDLRVCQILCGSDLKVSLRCNIQGSGARLLSYQLPGRRWEFLVMAWVPVFPRKALTPSPTCQGCKDAEDRCSEKMGWVGWSALWEQFHDLRRRSDLKDDSVSQSMRTKN